MPYSYATERDSLFTDEGQRLFLKIRDQVNHHLKESGAVRGDKAAAGMAGSSWQMLACLDRLVEIGELKRLSPPDVYGQHQVYVSGLRWVQHGRSRFCFLIITPSPRPWPPRSVPPRSGGSPRPPVPRPPPASGKSH